MTSSSKGANFECCMCGDSGLSYELFRCKVCQFRSQHRYCSNLYPNAQSYRACNWCLINKDENGASNSSNSSSPYKSAAGEQDPKSGKKKQFASPVAAAMKSSQPVSPIKKQRPSPESRKREGAEEAVVAVVANGSVTAVPRHVFRSKVRRYKLLEEVSS